MEEDDRFHGQFGEIGEILQEPRQNDRVGRHCELGLHLREAGYELTALQVLAQQVLEHAHDAGYHAEADRDILDVAEGCEMH